MKSKASLPAIYLFALAVLSITCTKPSSLNDIESGTEFLQHARFDAEQYTADSLKLLELYDEFWHYVNSDKIGRIRDISEKIIHLGEKLMHQRYDSLLYQAYATSYAGLGGALRENGYYDEGLKYTKRAVELISAKFTENHQRIAEICVSLAIDAGKRGDHDQAISYLHRSLNIIQEVMPPRHYYFINGLFNLSYFYTDMNDLEKAEYYANRVISLSKEWGITVNPARYANLIRVYLKGHNYEAARKVVNDAFSISKLASENHKEQLLRSYLLGIIYSRSGQYSNALNNLNAFTNGVNSVPDSNVYAISIGDAYFELGFLANKLQKPGLARTYFDQAQKSWKQYHGPNTQRIKNNFSDVSIFSGIAESYLIEKDFNSALKQLQIGLSFLVPSFQPTSIFSNPALEELAITEDVFHLLNEKRDVLYRYAQHSGNPEHWKTCFETARLVMQFVNQMRQSYKWEGSKQYLSAKAVPSLQKALEIGLEYQKLTGTNTLPSDFFTLLEQNRAINLREAIWDASIQYGGNLPDWIVRHEDSLKQALRFVQEVIVEQQRKQSVDTVLLYQLHTKKLKLNESLDSLILVFKKQYPEYYKLQFDTQKYTLKNLKAEVIRGDAALVEFFWGDSVLFTLSASQNFDRISRIPLTNELIEELESVTNQEAQTSFSNFFQTSHSLYNRLLAPLLPKNQPITQLIIIPDGPLHYLPFQILLEKAPAPEVLAAENWRDLPYLIKTKDIRYEYSAALMLQPAPRRRSHQHYYSGFAPAFSGQPLASRGIGGAVANRHWRGGQVPDLKQNRPEVQSIHEMLHTGKAFLANAATEQAFKQIAPHCSLLHLATHACADDQDPLYSQILFAPTPGDTSEDGALYAYELYNMQLNAELAVLSACQTGAGRLQRGEGVMSLSRAFKYAGCPNVVMSLWNADDAASKNIMLRFFENLKGGLNKDKALCQAQRDYLRQATLAEAHPAKWATFVLIGDDSPVEFSSPIWWVALLTLLLSALVLFVFFGRTKT